MRSLFRVGKGGGGSRERRSDCWMDGSLWVVGLDWLSVGFALACWLFRLVGNLHV